MSNCIMLRLQVKNDGSDALFMKEWFAHFKSDSLQICSFHQVFPLYMYALLALCKIWHWKELQERIAPVALLKRGTKSDLLLSLFTKRVKKAIRSMKRVNRYFALKKRAICKKKEWIPNPVLYSVYMAEHKPWHLLQPWPARFLCGDSDYFWYSLGKMVHL